MQSGGDLDELRCLYMNILSSFGKVSCAIYMSVNLYEIRMRESVKTYG